MEQIVQLKTMRDEALERLQVNPDFKLVNSLDALIQDLEAVMAPVADSVVEEPVQVEETADDTFEIAAESAVADAPVSEDAALSEAANLSADEAPIDAQTSEDAIGEELAELAADQPDEAASAIEALEAELAQSDIGAEEVSAQPGSMIN